jgi:exodeoxyribonuclease VII large subunit
VHDLFGDPTTPVPARRPAARGSSAERAAEPGVSPESAISVSTLTLATRDILEGAVEPLWVRGEVVGLKVHRSGHWYFTLADAEARIRCVTWASDARRIPATPDEGMTIVARGQLTVFPARGELQFRVVRMEAVGGGLWRKAFEEVRRKLEAEGLFAPGRKRALPRLPACVAVVTSPDGAAWHDIVSVIRRRCPITRVVAVPAVVQGEDAPESLVAALHRVARWGEADVVILGRGGGSRDDLWAFNDERVVRAAAGLPVPVISAVGHEVDVTLCDLAADHRAATPSAAAELAVPFLGDLVRQVRRLGAALRDAGSSHVEGARERLASAGIGMVRAATRPIEKRRLGLQGIAGRLNALSPLGTLARGYAVVTDASGRAVTSATAVRAGDELQARFRDGHVVVEARRVVPLDGEDTSS